MTGKYVNYISKSDLLMRGTRHGPWIIVAVALLLTVMLCGCVKNEFNVKFSLSSTVDRTYNVLYYASDSKKGWVIESVVSLQKGMAELRGMTRNPSLVYVFGSGSNEMTFFYVERGDEVSITGESANPLDWTIGGDKINSRLSEWRKANKQSIMQASGSGDQWKVLNAAVGKYVDEHPEDPVSTLLLLEYYDRGADESGFRKLWKKLAGEAVEAKWLELVSRNDMLEDVPKDDRLPKQLVFNTVATGCDTIESGRVPSLLYFSRSSSDSYKDDVKKLRELGVAFADSSACVIANVQLEPDSTVRWQSVRVDSLRNVVQAWVPLGVSDLQIRALRVGQIPYVIVTAKGGKVVYRGDDLGKGAEKLREEVLKH